jgi:hypothetical protein
MNCKGHSKSDGRADREAPAAVESTLRCYSSERNSATKLCNSRTAEASRCARCFGSSPRRGSNSVCKISHRLRYASSFGSARRHSKKSLNSCGYRIEPERKRPIISATCPGLSIFLLTVHVFLWLNSHKDVSGVAGCVKTYRCLYLAATRREDGGWCSSISQERAAVVTIDNSGSEKFAGPGAAIMTAVTPRAEARCTRSILDARSAPTNDHDGR